MSAAEVVEDVLRSEAVHQAENWLMAFGALIPSTEIENLSIKLAADIAKPAIDTAKTQAEQIAAVLALHEHWVANGECKHDGYFWPCPTVLALGVEK